MNSLGTKKLHKNPQYTIDKMGRIVSAKDYRTKGRVEVVFIDHGKAMPVWVVGDIDREPVAGDMVVIGYMEGRKDAPYLKAFIRNESYTANYIEVGKDYIRLQLPKTQRDRDGHMLDNAQKNSRVYLEINMTGGISLYNPGGDIYLNAPNGDIRAITKTGSRIL